MIWTRMLVWCAIALLLSAGSEVVLSQKSQKSTSDDSKREAQGNITIGREVMVSGWQRGWEHTEYIADAHPSDPNKVMICIMRYSQEVNQLTSGVYVTSNGGKTWKLAFNDDSSRMLGVWDPTCSFGEKGQAYFVTLSTDNKLLDEVKEPDNIPYELWGSSKARLMNLYSSVNGGETWGLTTKLSKIDREDLRVDRTNGRFRGRMYLYGGTSGRGMWIVYSKDGGKSWLRSAETNVEDVTMLRGHGTILPDSTLLLPYVESVSNEKDKKLTGYISVAASRDGGETVGRPIRIAVGQSDCGGMMAIVSDHSNGPFRGRAYIAWGQFVPGFSDSPRSCVILLSYSDDKGTSWSKPLRVTDSRIRHLEETILMPQIVVNNKGTVGVAWYEPKKSANGIEHWLRFSYSLDGGMSWAPGAEVSPYPYLQSTRPDFAARAIVQGGGYPVSNKSDLINVHVQVAPRSYQRNNNMFGDYAVGLAAGADGRFHAFWIGNRTGRGELYTAPISISGKVARPEDAFKGLDAVTSALEMQISSSVWDPAAKTLSLEYRFLNHSQETIQSPIKLKLRDVNSLLGAPNLVLPKTISGPTQLLIDASALVPLNGLAPGQTSGKGSLVFKFDRVVNHLSGIGDPIVRMNLEVYGTRRNER